MEEPGNHLSPENKNAFFCHYVHWNISNHSLNLQALKNGFGSNALSHHSPTQCSCPGDLPLHRRPTATPPTEAQGLFTAVALYLSAGGWNRETVRPRVFVVK